MKSIISFLVLSINLFSINANAGNVVRIIKDGSPPEYKETIYNAELKDFNYRATIAGGGFAEPDGGHLGEFIIEKTKIAIKSNEFKGGAIQTKELGNVRILFSSSLKGDGFIALLTNEQLTKLEEILALPQKAVANQSDPFNYDPIKTETQKLLVPSQYKLIQAAIDAAKDGATIIVAPGRYEEHIVISNKSLTLTSENPTDQKTVSETIIDAKGKDSVIVLENSNSKIYGFTICGGYSEAKGGGIRVGKNSSPLIKGNIIEKNKTGSLGGGIVLIQSAEPRIIENIIRQNEAQGGGGLYGISTTVYMQNNQVEENSVAKGGGGVWVQECGGAIYGNKIRKNKADAGGGVYISEKSTLEFAKNIISENSAAMAAGVFIIADCKLTITENNFLENKATKGVGGIAVGVGSACNLIGNTFENNEAPKYGVGMVEEATITEKDNKYIDNKPDNKIVKK